MKALEEVIHHVVEGIKLTFAERKLKRGRTTGIESIINISEITQLIQMANEGRCLFLS